MSALRTGSIALGAYSRVGLLVVSALRTGSIVLGAYSRVGLAIPPVSCVSPPVFSKTP